MRRGQVSVPIEAFRRWEAAAKARGITVGELVEQACDRISTVPVQLTPEVVRRLEAHAARQGLSVQTVVEFALGRLIGAAGLRDHRTGDHNGVMCPDCVAERAGV